MGASKSKVTASVGDIVNNSIAKTVLVSSQTCTGSSSAIQEMSFSDLEFTECCRPIFTGIQQDAAIHLNLSCAQDTSATQNLKEQLHTQLMTDISSKLSGVSVKTKASIETQINGIVNNIVKETDITNISQCVSSNLNLQKLTFHKIRISGCGDPSTNCAGVEPIQFSDIAQHLITEQVVACTQQNKLLQDYSTQLTTLIDQTLASENKGTSIEGVISSFFAGISMPLMIAMGIGGLILIILIISGLVIALSPSGQKAIDENSKLLMQMAMMRGNPMGAATMAI